MAGPPSVVLTIPRELGLATDNFGKFPAAGTDHLGEFPAAKNLARI